MTRTRRILIWAPCHFAIYLACYYTMGTWRAIAISCLAGWLILDYLDTKAAGKAP